MMKLYWKYLKLIIGINFDTITKTILRTMIYSIRGGTDHAVKKGKI